jgi:hypothetical protein
LIDGLAVDGEDDVAGLNVGGLSGTVRQNIHEDHLRVVSNAKSGGESGRDVLGDHPDGSAPDAAFRPKLVAYPQDQVAWDGEADPPAAAGLAQDHGVDSGDTALDIEHRAPAVAGVDGRISLNVANRTSLVEVALGCADEAHGERVL